MTIEPSGGRGASSDRLCPRTGSIGSAKSTAPGVQAPMQRTTVAALRLPEAVSTPVTRFPSRCRPVTVTPVSTRAPSSAAARAKARVSSGLRTWPSPGDQRAPYRPGPSSGSARPSASGPSHSRDSDSKSRALPCSRCALCSDSATWSAPDASYSGSTPERSRSSAHSSGNIARLRRPQACRGPRCAASASGSSMPAAAPDACTASWSRSSSATESPSRARK